MVACALSALIVFLLALWSSIYWTNRKETILFRYKYSLTKAKKEKVLAALLEDAPPLLLLLLPLPPLPFPPDCAWLRRMRVL